MGWYFPCVAIWVSLLTGISRRLWPMCHHSNHIQELRTDLVRREQRFLLEQYEVLTYREMWNYVTGCIPWMPPQGWPGADSTLKPGSSSLSHAGVQNMMGIIGQVWNPSESISAFLTLLSFGISTRLPFCFHLQGSNTMVQVIYWQ
jgi:hypothetical protein